MLATWMKTQNKMSQGARDQNIQSLTRSRETLSYPAAVLERKLKHISIISFSDAVSKNIELGKFPDEKERCDVGDRGIL